jgi:DNA topoisomerase I
MVRNLVIVESPAKARTIERYLGDDYKVLASYGHVRDLPDNPGKGKFGVDVDHDFAPEYVVSEDRRKQVDAIERAARSAETVFLATDLDREGEAIAWHVAEAAKVPEGRTQRVTF